MALRLLGLQECEWICGVVVNWQRRFVGIFASCRQMPTVEFGGSAERGLEEGNGPRIILGCTVRGREDTSWFCGCAL